MSTLIEVVEAFTTKKQGQVSSWFPGQRMRLSPEKAQRVIEQVGSKARLVTTDTIDLIIGTVRRYLDDGSPWIVADATDVVNAPDLVKGRWLYLLHGPDWRIAHESHVSSEAYQCPSCKGVRFWSSEHTVICAECHPPADPQWRELWRDLAAYNAEIAADDPRYGAWLTVLKGCEDAYEVRDYVAFQYGVVRARRVSQGRMDLEKKQ